MKSSRRKTAAALLSALALTLSLLTGCSLQPHEKKLPVKVLILPTNEELMIARDTFEIVTGK